MDERNKYRNSSTYGSLAYDLDALALERRLDEAGTMPRQREAAPRSTPQRRTHTAARPKASPLLIGSIAALCTMVAVLLFGYVQLTTVAGSVSALKSEIVRLTDENISLTTQYERTFDLATIKAVAEENGMSKPTSGQIEYIDIGGEDTAVVYAGAQLTDSRLTESVTRAAQWLWEYFR